MKSANDIAGAHEETSRRQAAAADPAASVWVSANAGTGKTHVLTQRVLRLLLAGTPPERILCLTYTKAAAAEMASRVFQTLAGWVTLPEAELAKVLFALDGRAPDDQALRRARTLFAKAIETPGGLKVQTIHAFSERLLQRFPLEAGVPPAFSILDDETAKKLKAEAINAVLKSATDAPGSLLGDALRTAVAYAADTRFDEVLSAAIEERDAISGAVQLDKVASGNEPPLAAFEGLLRKHFNVGADATDAALNAKLARVLPDGDLRNLRDALSASSGNDLKRATTLSDALTAGTDAVKAAALKPFFLIKDGGAAKSLMNKPVKDQNPELDEIATRAQGNFKALWDEAQSLKGVTATIALTRLAGTALETYISAKARRAALDFDDLIQRTRYLLGTEGGRTAWVLYKLDGGLDHILVDEAQDTSPAQWRIVEALASEFFAGVAARDEKRTLFAVGDEKQSIYSFQGARPEKFAESGAHFKAMAGAAGETWREIGLTLSFRSVEPVLGAVDQVFADPGRTPGLIHSSGADATIRHIARRKGHAGFIEIWPTEKADAVPDVRAFEPLDEPARASPVLRLANKIAATIDGWLKTGERLPSEDRPIRAGDVLILVNRRRPFAGPMVAALKARGIPVAGADRMTLSEQIAVQDLVALGRFLTLPEDDLALAEVLKGPLIGFDDDDLMRLAIGRKGTLWKALLDAANTDARFGAVATQLKRWRARADFAPPYEFFATLLEKDRGREKLLARLGPEAADPIDEFLNLALTYDDGAPPSLTGFLTMLSETGKEVKRDMEQGADEVRVMTVHGAKGLEAPIVFLPDTCTTRTYRPTTSPLIRLPKMDRPDDVPPPVFWHIKGAGDLAPVEAAKADLNEREREEYNRLLYVAMTRARDRLYVAGYESAKAKGRDKGCWYDLVVEALGGGDARRDEAMVLRRAAEQTAAPEPPKVTLAASQAAVALPEFALRPAPREITSSVPLAPSRLEPYAHDDTGEPGTPQRPERMRDEPAVVSPGAANEEARFLRGTLTHALLQHLPGLPPADWEAAAKGYVAMRARGLTKRAVASIVTETLSILNEREFADLFRAPSRAEVPVAAIIQRKGAKGPPLKMSGQIDRLVERARDILIIDYKTNRVAPEHPSGVADAYLFQLAAYRLALQEIYPGKPVRAALLWTAAPKLMEISSAVLDAAEKRLFALDFARLDA